MNHPDDPPLEELDLVLERMQTSDDEKKVQEILQNLPGIQAATIIREGAWMSYHPNKITKEKVEQKLAEAGYYSVTFQDSLSGETNEVSQD